MAEIFLPVRIFPKLLFGLDNTNLEILFDNLYFIGFNIEQKKYLIDIFNMHYTKYGEKWIKQLLIVMTGSNIIPKIGYVHYKLRIELNDLPKNKKINIHTCFNQFIIDLTYYNDSMVETNDFTTSNIYKLFDYDNLIDLENEITNA